ncbi:saccharopine dehydrogenase C-terminal domain-containing protein [Draconibacterium sp. IB214405]|uniref:saccharopine dehydrogenase C-terminal domain-containing protein n=1 Tax=Draconibacterium sp. IB214405 TaxID=3097352 RepID=UPI002A0D8860|nr:saccharopine dehydrogenase C-terminal domain-containing protein [Draconibacterium sp. IB214405]MDX8341245.1 saccharopine dehydrogenase C-terminal domain-containing protein [Draconibacterium sp. IB214405]
MRVPSYALKTNNFNKMKVLLLGAGMVAKPLADYILKNQIELTIASRTLSKAEKLLGNRNGIAIQWTIDDTDQLDKLIASHDLTVSLLPYTHHVTVAKLCINHKKNMVTTSYVSDEMKALDAEAKEAGIIILNEIGVDPGFDHMTAMRIIDKVKDKGGKVKEFYSLCGALAAPEEANNPFKYKFSWSPKGVIMAGNNGAKYLKDGEIVELPTENLFKNPLKLDFPEVGEMEVYPNRDSLAYIDLYGLKDIATMYRGTFRYPDWCEIMDAIKTLGLVTYDQQSFAGKTYKKIMARQLGVYPANIKEKVAERLRLPIDSPAIVAMEWLGLFSEYMVAFDEGSNFDMVTDLMLKKMMLPEGARDMVIMLHSFLVENADGSTEVVKSHLLDFATKEDTSIARTVGLPAGIGVKMILNGKITDKGVHIPISKSIYEPILTELAKLGIAMKEEWGLKESAKINV